MKKSRQGRGAGELWSGRTVEITGHSAGVLYMQGYVRIMLELPDQEDIVAIVCLVRRVLVINTKARAGAKLVLIKQTV